ncbi:MAG TPA: DUF3089 domain-containing protein [Bryobacteraceae bacterium]|nr:DUF3089 domain-containing protein [Bryobacteraceae bacterium]
MVKRITFAAGAVWLALAATASAQANDYSDAKSWLCRPGQHDACDVDLTTTVLGADGALSREAWAADTNAAIDCFYVYATVSTDPTPNSDMIADAAERNVIRQQFARFAAKCRPYAPMYRQVTLAGLRRVLTGGGGGAALDHGLQYDDVRDAWNYYLEHDNRGRGFVLIGHSQGSLVLTRLIKEEIDSKPVQARLVSAILMGTTLAVPFGKDVGGAFQHVPLCHSTTQTGCVMVYASFRSTSPPPANTLFGKVAGPNMTAACTNPAALTGGSGELHAYLSTDGSSIAGASKPKPWVVPAQPIDTPFVSVPGLVTAQCMTNDNATYLEISVHADPAGRRTDDIAGDLSMGNQVQANWGLHLVDVNLAMGNLIDIVGRQAKAWSAAGAKAPRGKK